MADTIRVANVRTQPAHFPRIRPIIIGQVAAEQMTRLRIGPASIVGQPRLLLAGLTDGISRRMMPHVKMPFSTLVSDGAVKHGTEAVGPGTPEANLADPVVTSGVRPSWDRPVGFGQGRPVGDLQFRLAAGRTFPVAAD